MKITSRYAMCAVSAAVLLGGTAINHDPQGQPAAHKIANGNGVTGTPGEGLRTFSFSLVELPGHPRVHHPHGFQVGVDLREIALHTFVIDDPLAVVMVGDMTHRGSSMRS